jgi:hypothetical protein
MKNRFVSYYKRFIHSGEPPIAPSSITSMGTSTPRPNNIGFKNESAALITILKTRNITAYAVDIVLKGCAKPGAAR